MTVTNIRTHGGGEVQRAAQRMGPKRRWSDTWDRLDRCLFQYPSQALTQRDARQGLLYRMYDLPGSESLIEDGEDGGGEDGGVSNISMISVSGGAGVLTTS